MAKSIPMYGQNGDGVDIQDVVDLFSPNQIGQVEGKGFITKKAVHTFKGATSANSGAIIAVDTNTSVWGGFVRVEGVGSDEEAGALDFDLGLTAGAADFGAGYGLQGDGLYALKAHEFVSSSSEDVHLSIDVNTVDSSKTITVTIVMIMAVAPASS
tara:strand:- start:4046 stop:4513 length:468 start_codon:yes stop_codon:yes gene_type:complete